MRAAPGPEYVRVDSGLGARRARDMFGFGPLHQGCSHRFGSGSGRARGINPNICSHLSSCTRPWPGAGSMPKMSIRVQRFHYVAKYS